MRKILALKNWQLFLLVFICGAWTSPSPLKEIINSIGVITFSLWIYAIGVFGQEKILELELKPMNLKILKINVLVMCVSALIALFFFSSDKTTTHDSFELKHIPLLLGGLYSFFAIIQTIIFACKTIAKIELRKEVLFSDYYTNLFLIFFFFIGVWVLQPKLNKFFATNEEIPA